MDSPRRTSIRSARGRPPAARLTAVCLLLGSLLGACAEPAARDEGTALVALREALERELMVRLQVARPDDSSLVVTLPEYDRAATTAADRARRARRIASRTVRYWPDPALRQVHVVIQRQTRLGPLANTSEPSRYTFSAAEAAPPPALDSAPAPLPLARH